MCVLSWEVLAMMDVCWKDPCQQRHRVLLLLSSQRPQFHGFGIFSQTLPNFVVCVDTSDPLCKHCQDAAHQVTAILLFLQPHFPVHYGKLQRPNPKPFPIFALPLVIATAFPAGHLGSALGLNLWPSFWSSTCMSRRGCVCLQHCVHCVQRSTGGDRLVNRM